MTQTNILAPYTRDPGLDDFLIESREILDRVSQFLLQDSAVSNTHALPSEQIASVYRDVHTLKGNAQLFGYHSMGRVAHALEAILDSLRRSPKKLPPRLSSTCLKALRLLDRMVSSLDTGDPLKDEQHQSEIVVLSLADAATALFGAEIRTYADPLLSARSKQTRNTVPSRNSDYPYDTAGLGFQNENRSGNSGSQRLAETERDLEDSGAAPLSETSLRISVQLLDRVLGLVSELVLVRNQILQFSSEQISADFSHTQKELDHITSLLQAEVMKTRIQTLESLSGKVQRLVREMAMDLNKQIHIEFQGLETELDRSVLEGLRDALLHLIRNACDHGIEGVEERRIQGKPDHGTVRLKAYPENGQLLIEVSDDGRGLNSERIRQKAIERKLISPQAAALLSTQGALELIYLPGLSTADHITSLSGRGVGMDIVKTNLARMGGRIELKSQVGIGTTFQLKIPLTLAIVPSLIVLASEMKFAIPQSHLLELVRTDASTANHTILWLQGRPMLALRDQILPLVILKDLIQESLPREIHSLSAPFIAIVQSDQGPYGLMVEEIQDTVDIVVKSLATNLNYKTLFSGTSVLGDGTIALILDLNQLALQDCSVSESTGRPSPGRNQQSTDRIPLQVSKITQDYLSFSNGTEEYFALPLNCIHRIEDSKSLQIQQSGTTLLAEYRNGLLPLLSTCQTQNHPKVIVIHWQGEQFGLLVHSIEDILPLTGEPTRVQGMQDLNHSVNFAIQGTLYQNGQLYSILDATLLIQRLREIKGKSRQFNTLSYSSEPVSYIKPIRILYVDDSESYRKTVSQCLLSSGFQVHTVKSAFEALIFLAEAKPTEIDLIVSDIEMPDQNGFELARKIRLDHRWSQIPLIALSSRFNKNSIDEGFASGFNEYIEKLDTQNLINSIQRTCELHHSALSSLGEKEYGT